MGCPHGVSLGRVHDVPCSEELLGFPVGACLHCPTCKVESSSVTTTSPSTPLVLLDTAAPAAPEATPSSTKLSDPPAAPRKRPREENEEEDNDLVETFTDVVWEHLDKLFTKAKLPRRGVHQTIQINDERYKAFVDLVRAKLAETMASYEDHVLFTTKLTASRILL